jgi:hypothetical protein
MDKQFIIGEIQRLAVGGKAPGQKLFTSETGIKTHEWQGKFWARWGDALVEAGFSPNEWCSAFEEAHVIENFLLVARELGKFPTKAEISMARSKDSTIPSFKAVTRLGTRPELKAKLLKFCAVNTEFADLQNLIQSMSLKEPVTSTSVATSEEVAGGYVYLVKAQAAYKIGSTRAPYRRVSEIANQSANGAELLHLIATDDPEGIEKYWHTRFDEMRIIGLNKQSGEWFALSADEIKAFRRRKTM